MNCDLTNALPPVSPIVTLPAMCEGPSRWLVLCRISVLQWTQWGSVCEVKPARSSSENLTHYSFLLGLADHCAVHLLNYIVLYHVCTCCNIHTVCSTLYLPDNYAHPDSSVLLRTYVHRSLLLLQLGANPLCASSSWSSCRVPSAYPYNYSNLQ